MDLFNLSDEAILKEITKRIKQKRLNSNITQQELAKQTGLHVQTIKNFESGKSTKLITLIQILRVFGELDALDNFVQAPGVSPVELLKLKGKERERASGKSTSNKNDLKW